MNIPRKLALVAGLFCIVSLSGCTERLDKAAVVVSNLEANPGDFDTFLRTAHQVSSISQDCSPLSTPYTPMDLYFVCDSAEFNDLMSRAKAALDKSVRTLAANGNSRLIEHTAPNTNISMGIPLLEIDEVKDTVALSALKLAEQGSDSVAGDVLLRAAEALIEGRLSMQDYAKARSYLIDAWKGGETKAAGPLAELAMFDGTVLDAYLWSVRCVHKCYVPANTLETITHRIKLFPAKVVLEVQEKAKTSALAVNKDL